MCQVSTSKEVCSIKDFGQSLQKLHNPREGGKEVSETCDALQHMDPIDISVIKEVLFDICVFNYYFSQLKLSTHVKNNMQVTRHISDRNN